MSENLYDSLQKFYYNMGIQELKTFNNKNYNKISYSTNLYLGIIQATPNCTVSFLAEQLCVSKAAVTMRISELIDKGFVVKKQSETDRRINYLYLCDSILEEYEEYDFHFKKIADRIQSQYTTKEIALFCDILDRFNQTD